MPLSRERLVPLIVAVALFMENMDSTVIATALPAIAADIGTSPLALKLAITSYLLALAVFIPISGWMADRFGARHVFLAYHFDLEVHAEEGTAGQDDDRGVGQVELSRITHRKSQVDGTRGPSGQPGKSGHAAR
jgi:hypothetical protein